MSRLHTTYRLVSDFDDSFQNQRPALFPLSKKKSYIDISIGASTISGNQWIVTLNTIMNGECTRFLDICPQHSLRPSIVPKMIMTGRYKVTGPFFLLQFLAVSLLCRKTGKSKKPEI